MTNTPLDIDKHPAKPKAKVMETIERGGDIIAVYDNGMEYNKSKGRLAKPPAHAKITAQNTNEYKRLRQEKTARLLRDAIRAETMDKLDVPHTATAAAVAAAGGILWREIVLDPNAYPRDRMEAWEKLGKYAQVLLDPKQQQQEQAAQAAATGVGCAAGAG